MSEGLLNLMWRAWGRNLAIELALPSLQMQMIGRRIGRDALLSLLPFPPERTVRKVEDHATGCLTFLLWLDLSQLNEPVNERV